MRFSSCSAFYATVRSRRQGLWSPVCRYKGSCSIVEVYKAGVPSITHDIIQAVRAQGVWDGCSAETKVRRSLKRITAHKAACRSPFTQAIQFHAATWYHLIPVTSLITVYQVWSAYMCAMQELVKTHGMKCLAEEKNPALMSQLADCMSQVANQTWQNEQERWVGVLQHLQQFIMSDDPHLLEVALTLYAKLTEWLSQEDVKNAAQMYEVLLRCLQHPNRRVQLAAATASVSFINVRFHHTAA